MPGQPWSVLEQTVNAAEPVTVSSIQFSVEPSSAHEMVLSLLSADGSSYVLKFNRGGTFTSAAKVEPTPPPEPLAAEPPVAHASTHGKKK